MFVPKAIRRGASDREACGGALPARRIASIGQSAIALDGMPAGQSGGQTLSQPDFVAFGACCTWLFIGLD
jgi:hypothetical protein